MIIQQVKRVVPEDGQEVGKRAIIKVLLAVDVATETVLHYPSVADEPSSSCVLAQLLFCRISGILRDSAASAIMCGIFSFVASMVITAHSRCSHIQTD